MIKAFLSSVTEWAAEQFAGSCIEDPRLQRRVQAYATAQAADPVGSTARVCGDDKAAQMGAYRLLGNRRVKASSIDAGPRQATVQACAGRPRILCIQDTTSLIVSCSALREQLASSGSPTGFAVHTAIAVDGVTGEYLGALDQQRWLRKGSEKRYPHERESSKWSVSDAAVRKVLGDMSDVILVADREADILPFLHEKAIHSERFVIRAKHNRRLYEEMDLSFAALRASPIIGNRELEIEQRGSVAAKGIEPGRKGRKRRVVTTNIQACEQIIVAQGSDLPPLQLNCVRVSSTDSETLDGEGNLEWILFTSEPIDCLERIIQIVRDYEHRWIIEELHKVWKTGCRLEERPLQSVEAVETMMAITLPIAGRLMRLHTAARSNEIDHDVTTPLSDDELACLWAATEKKAYPERRPNAAWAILAIARLGGWYDSKHTGRVGWQALWRGWDLFSQRLAGWLAASRFKNLRLV